MIATGFHAYHPNTTILCHPIIGRDIRMGFFQWMDRHFLEVLQDFDLIRFQSQIEDGDFLQFFKIRSMEGPDSIQKAVEIGPVRSCVVILREPVYRLDKHERGQDKFHPRTSFHRIGYIILSEKG